MELCGIPQSTIDWSGSNLPQAWTKFKQHVTLIFTGQMKGTGTSFLPPVVGWGQRKKYIPQISCVSAKEKKKLKPHLRQNHLIK